MRRAGAVGSVLVASALALVPLPPAKVERWYSAGAYAWLQPVVTSISNAVPFALFDVLLVAAGIAWLVTVGIDIARARRGGWQDALGRVLGRSLTMAALAYVAFLAMWGLNYRRLALTQKIEFDVERVTAESARAVAGLAVVRLNDLHGEAHAAGWPDAVRVDAPLASAFAGVQRTLGVQWTPVAGRPKQTLVDAYFRRAGVDGMTDPYFLETLVASDLLPFERPFVVAHEWSHLAGFGDEGEANFVGWLTCMHAGASAEYSAWLFLYSELGPAVGGRDRAALAPGPRDDLRAIAERLERNVSPPVARAGWRVYDRYLKANRVQAGAASYAEVIRLVLGTRFDARWTPTLKRSLSEGPR